MPKVSKTGKFRTTAAASAAKPATVDSENTSLSRGQRKRQAKRDQYLKRQSMILSSLELKRKDSTQKKAPLAGLDALRKAIVQTTTTTTTASSKETKAARVASNKGKQKVAAREVTHMSLVLQHPAYQSDPFATMQEHLRNTLASSKKELEEQAQEQTRTNLAKEAAHKQRKKERLQEHGGKHRKKFRAARRSGR